MVQVEYLKGKAQHCFEIDYYTCVLVVIHIESEKSDLHLFKFILKIDFYVVCEVICGGYFKKGLVITVKY